MRWKNQGDNEMKSLTVYANDKIHGNEDGSFDWISNSGASERFEDGSSLLNYAEENEPQTYETIKEWILRNSARL